MEYKEWRKFKGVIEKAITACKANNNNELNHFVGADKMVHIGSTTGRKVKDYKLSRYACYLIVQNGDTRKQTIALGQIYFAVQTRRMELTDLEYEKMDEDEKII